MSYFKLFFSELKANKLNIILPLLILVIYSIVMVEISGNDISTYKPDIYLVDNDNTEFSKELVEEIKKYTNVLEYTGKEDIEDELMKSWISLYIEIPQGFSTNFEEYKVTGDKNFKSKNKIIVKSIENSTHKVFIDEKIDNYLNSKLNDTEVKDNSFLKLDLNTAIETDNTTVKLSTISFSAYGLVYGTILIIGTFLFIIRKKDVKDRYSCSPVSRKQYILQIILSSICLTIAFTLIIAIFIMSILLKMPIDTVWFLNFLNMLLIAIIGVGLGLIFGTIAKNKEMLSGISTGTSLALAFLGGLFVPLELFSDSMKVISKFMPTYWYEEVNYMLNTSHNNIQTGTLLSSFGMQLVFIAIVYVVVFIINRKNRAK